MISNMTVSPLQETKPGAEEGRGWGKRTERREWESMGSGEQVTEAHSVMGGAPPWDTVTLSAHLACTY